MRIRMGPCKRLVWMQAQQLAAADWPTRRAPGPPHAGWRALPFAPDLGHDLFEFIRARRHRSSTPAVIEPEIVAADYLPVADGQHLRKVMIVVFVRMSQNDAR